MPPTGPNLAEEQWQWWLTVSRENSALGNCLFLVAFTIRCCYCFWNQQTSKEGLPLKATQKVIFLCHAFQGQMGKWMRFICRTRCIWQSAQDGSVTSTLKPVSSQDDTEFCTTWVKFSSKTQSYLFLMLKHPLLAVDKLVQRGYTSPRKCKSLHTYQAVTLALHIYIHVSSASQQRKRHFKLEL